MAIKVIITPQRLPPPLDFRHPSDILRNDDPTAAADVALRDGVSRSREFGSPWRAAVIIVYATKWRAASEPGDAEGTRGAA